MGNARKSFEVSWPGTDVIEALGEHHFPNTPGPFTLQRILQAARSADITRSGLPMELWIVISPELALVIGDFGLSYSERRALAGSAAAARRAGRAEARIARVSIRKTLAV